MTALDLIRKKRDKLALSEAEIIAFVDMVTKDKIPPYQIAAMLMAIYINGMDLGETKALTNAMARSGAIMDLSGIEGFKIDKHSTGGVGDKTSLVLGPMVAAVGLKWAKLSGGGLGFTGGTLDKLSAFPGFNTNLSRAEFFNVLQTTGIVISGQTSELVPADKKLYALRNVTATVDCLPLIAGSIMSKKIAGGAQGIVLDVKVGSGAIYKTLAQAKSLAELLVDIGKNAGLKIRAVISNMDQPLGFAIGNALEVREAIHTLQGHGPKDLLNLCLELGTHMLQLAGISSDPQRCIDILKGQITSGAALHKLKNMVEAQGGDTSFLQQTSTTLTSAPLLKVLKADKAGYIHQINAKCLGAASMTAGAGRSSLNGDIDLDAGIILTKKVGDPVKKDEPLLIIQARNKDKLESAYSELKDTCKIGHHKPEIPPLVLDVIY